MERVCESSEGEREEELEVQTRRMHARNKTSEWMDGVPGAKTSQAQPNNNKTRRSKRQVEREGGKQTLSIPAGALCGVGVITGNIYELLFSKI